MAGLLTTTDVVKRQKARIAREKRFLEALAKAKRPKCPECGGDPEGFDYSDESEFRCGARHTWKYMKTRKEVEAEKALHKTAADKERAERMKEARENPSFIRLPDTPEELHEKVKPWLLRKIQQLTGIDKVRVFGKRGDEVVEIDYQEPSRGYQRMSLTFKVGNHSFGFDVEEKQYKTVDTKSRVDMDWNMKTNEESREALRRFFAEIVKTDKDP